MLSCVTHADGLNRFSRPVFSSTALSICLIRQTFYSDIDKIEIRQHLDQRSFREKGVGRTSDKKMIFQNRINPALNGM